MRFSYLVQNLCWNNRSEDILSPQWKPIVSPIFSDCTISFVFLKKISQKLKNLINLWQILTMRHYGGHFVTNWHHNLNFWKKVNLPCSNHLVPLIVFSVNTFIFWVVTETSSVQNKVLALWKSYCCTLPFCQTLIKQPTYWSQQKCHIPTHSYILLAFWWAFALKKKMPFYENCCNCCDPLSYPVPCKRSGYLE